MCRLAVSETSSVCGASWVTYQRTGTAAEREFLTLSIQPLIIAAELA